MNWAMQLPPVRAVQPRFPGDISDVPNLLFICSQNRLRSPTPEAVFSGVEGVQAISAGTNSDSATVVSGDLIEWADLIFVMEKTHRNKTGKKCRPLLKGKRVIVLDIPDIFDYMDPALISLLKSRVSRYVRL